MLEMLRGSLSQENLFTNTEGHKIENPYRYEADESGQTTKDSNIELADVWTEELETTDPRPIILTQRGPLGFHDSSIDGFKNSDARGLAIEYADFLRMPLTFLCFAQKDLMSEEIALVAALLLRFFRHTILRNTLLHKIDSPVIGEVAVITRGSRSNLYSTPVSFSVYMPINWVVKTSQPKQARGFAVSTSFPSMK
jgi:hypothetical protein